ncbi:MAG: 3 beta-hydroxysteroid dehydrogenase/Delta 5--_4-isomerase [Verrucomicrobia bacterium ADurb.Bin345]|nr:MAG: 3 beta-hydroxysteroid dehydrogenase/Delta 5-->4-isomerase [Verrucomicrobia bacterium ADurb.Bin345]
MSRLYLVTGAAGFVGSYVVRELCAAGYRVRGLVRQPGQAAGVESAGAEAVIGDIRDPQTLAPAMAGAAGVCHIAAMFRQANEPDQVYYDINATGTRNVLDAAIAAGVPRVVHCSTVGVLGHIEHPPADETTPYNAGDIYQRSKMEGEKAALDYFRSGRIGGVVIRPAMIYGPGDTRTLKMFRMIAKGTFFYVGRGDNLVHFIDVRDLARAFRLALERVERNGGIYIIAGARAMPLRELAACAARELGVHPPRLRVPVKPMQWLGSLCEAVCVPLRINPPLYRRRVDFFTKDRCFDGHLAAEHLGFRPAQTPQQEIRDILKDYRDRG